MAKKTKAVEVSKGGSDRALRSKAERVAKLVCKGEICFDEDGTPVLKIPARSKKNPNGCPRNMVDKLMKQFKAGKSLRVDMPVIVNEANSEH